MGEAKKREVAVRQQVVEALGLQTASGPIKVRWDPSGYDARTNGVFHRVSCCHRPIRSMGEGLFA